MTCVMDSALTSAVVSLQEYADVLSLSRSKLTAAAATGNSLSFMVGRWASLYVYEALIALEENNECLALGGTRFI